MSKTMNGIDISKWQKGIDLAKVKCDFVIAKATEGATYADPTFASHIQQAQKLGKCIGFYHFARPETNEAAREAMNFYRVIKPYITQGIPVLDWESSGKANVAWAKKWLDEIYRLTGVRAMIYMSESVANAYDWSGIAKDHGLWVAKYRDNQPDRNYDMRNAGRAPRAKFWPTIAMWQWTSTGRIDGYDGNLDCDIFYGDAEAWRKYAKASTAATEPPTAPQTQPPTNNTPATKKPTIAQAAQDVIAGKYGNGAVRILKLRKLGFSDAEIALIQKRVNTLLKKETTYTVKKGDTLSTIAQKYGITYQQIAKKNGIKAPYSIYPGQKLKI